jgi:hypothetical protein
MDIDRRRAVFLAAAAVAAVATPAAAATAGLAGVRVDTAPIAARGLPNYARRVAAASSAAATSALADRIRAGDSSLPTLVLRLDMVTLSSDVGSGRHSGQFGSDQQRDWIEGEAVLVDRRGRVLGSKRITTYEPATWHGNPDIMADEDVRIARVVQVFAYWAVRQLAL